MDIGEKERLGKKGERVKRRERYGRKGEGEGRWGEEKGKE